jgi:Uma2 family endonuclease
LSTFNQINEIKIKLKEYFKNGVEVVWLIMPDQYIVEACTSSKDVTIYIKTDTCSTQPVLDDSEIMVEELLK